MAQSRSQLTPNVSANQAAYSVSIVGKKVTVNTEGTSVASQPRVTVQRPPVQIGGSRRPVTITPISINTGALPCNVSTIPTSPTVIEKVLLKAVSRAGKTGFKMFTLRNIDCNKISSRDDLIREIRRQLLGDIIQSEFDVGFVSGTSVISICNPADLAEVWMDIKKGHKVVLWCDGLKVKSSSSTAVTTRRRPARESDRDESDEDTDVVQRGQKKKKKLSAQEEREEKVQRTIQKLKEKHGSSYTPMQIRIWSESVVGGIHSSLVEAPTSSMFTRAGKGDSVKKKDSSMSEALTQAALAISNAFSPRPTLPSTSSSQPMASSPAKVVESRSKCYKQLSDLNQLKASGIISEVEYAEEKESVMSVLRKLRNN